ncbi:hypothetical protein MRX96_050612 [Rhipicephalus microplus]
MTGPSAVSSRSQSLPSSSASTPATTKATATVAPLPVAPQQAPASRPGVAQVVSASSVLAPLVPPLLIQPKQPQILPKLSSGSANMTTPSAAATTRSQSPRSAQHKATPRPAPLPAPQPATTVQRGAAIGLNTGSPLLIGNPAAAQPGMFPAGPAHGTFLLNQYIPGLGHSPILIQCTLGQTPSSLGQIQGVQLALRPPHATGLTLGPQTGPRPHGGTSRTAWHPDACHSTEPGAKAQHISGTATHDVAPLVCHSPGTATDAGTAAGHAAHADHAGPAHTGSINGQKKFVCAVENAVSRVDSAQCHVAHTRVVLVLSRLQAPSSSSLSSEERQAVGSLRGHHKLVILPAVKGTATVLLDRTDYSRKMLTLLQDTNTSLPPDRDPTAKVQKKLAKSLGGSLPCCSL